MNIIERLNMILRTLETVNYLAHKDKKRELLEELSVVRGMVESACTQQETTEREWRIAS